MTHIIFLGYHMIIWQPLDTFSSTDLFNTPSYILPVVELVTKVIGCYDIQ